MAEALDDIMRCVDLGWQRVGGPRQIVAETGGAQSQIATTRAVHRESYEGTALIVDADALADLLEHFEEFRFTRAFDWTPPDASAAGKHRWAEFQVTPRAAVWAVRFTLAQFNGV